MCDFKSINALQLTLVFLWHTSVTQTGGLGIRPLAVRKKEKKKKTKKKIFMQQMQYNAPNRMYIFHFLL